MALAAAFLGLAAVVIVVVVVVDVVVADVFSRMIVCLMLGRYIVVWRTELGTDSEAATGGREIRGSALT